MSKLGLIIDSREKHPLQFSPDIYGTDHITYVDKLDAGDYSLAGHDRPNDDNSIIFERKMSCAELITDLGQEWTQFETRLKILSSYCYKSILVCANECFWSIYNNGLTKLHPNFVFSRLSYIYINYQIPTLFLVSRANVENYIWRCFIKVVEKTRNDT